MLTIALLTFISFGTIDGCSEEKNEIMTGNTPPVDHSLWDSLLKRHVAASGMVDYKGFIRDSMDLKRYLALLSAANPDSDNWTKEEKMAFWINAYNAFTVALIADHYPVESIKDIKHGIPFVNSVWDIKFISIGGKKYDLNMIEHRILRSRFHDARVHAAINCASNSCPALRSEAYVAARLDYQLTDAMHGFVNDTARNRVSEGSAEVSEIFSWFSGDFTRDAGSIRNYLNQYADVKFSGKGAVAHLPYDWHLNDSK